MKTKLFIFLSLLLTSYTFAQTSTETFETESNNATSFTDNSQVFNISSQAGGTFVVQGSLPAFGWNGTAIDDKFIDNFSNYQANVNVKFTISSAGAVNFRVNSFYLYLGDQNTNITGSGTVTVIGKRAGIAQFTATASSGFNTNFGINNGFTKIDLTTFGGSNNTSTNIDQLEISTSSSFCYVALDAFTWSKIPCTLTSSLVSKTDITCNGDNNGSATISASNGTTPYSYSWTNGATTASISGLSAGSYTCTITDALNCKSTQNVTITQPSIVSSLPTTDQTETVNITVAKRIKNSSCEHLLSLIPATPNALSGSVTVKSWYDANTTKWVRRHFEVTPATNPNTAKATVKLFFKQADFDAFNAVSTNTLKLPTSPTDNTGKANLRIEKISGSSSDGSGLPNTYTGTVSTIDPDDSLIFWDAIASQWQIDFDVIGFSGFFVKTQTATLSTDNYNSEKENFSISPNPVADYLNVEINADLLHTKAQICNMDGKILSQIELKDLSQKIPVSYLSNGIYLLKFANGKVFKFVKK